MCVTRFAYSCTRVVVDCISLRDPSIPQGSKHTCDNLFLLFSQEAVHERDGDTEHADDDLRQDGHLRTGRLLRAREHLLSIQSR